RSETETRGRNARDSGLVVTRNRASVFDQSGLWARLFPEILEVQFLQFVEELVILGRKGSRRRAGLRAKRRLGIVGRQPEQSRWAQGYPGADAGELCQQLPPGESVDTEKFTVLH